MKSKDEGDKKGRKGGKWKAVKTSALCKHEGVSCFGEGRQGRHGG